MLARVMRGGSTADAELSLAAGCLVQEPSRGDVELVGLSCESLRVPDLDVDSHEYPELRILDLI